MKSRTVRKTTRLPASAQTVFERLKSLQTLQFIAAPYATFTPVQGGATQWQQGETFSFSLKLFGVFPLGLHTIRVLVFDAAAHRIFTKESNPHVPVWNHRIVLEPLGEDASRYTDEVELYAGWKTPFVYLWANCFYAHRQRKWKKWLRMHG